MPIRSDAEPAGELLGDGGSTGVENPFQAITAPPHRVSWICPPLAHGLHLRPGFRCRRNGGESVCGICVGDLAEMKPVTRFDDGSRKRVAGCRESVARAAPQSVLECRISRT